MNVLPQIIQRTQSQEIITRYHEVVDTFCQFLKNAYDIDAESLPEFQESKVIQRFLSFDNERKVAKLDNFETFYRLCQEFTVSGLSLTAKQKSLYAYLRKYNLRVPEVGDVFDTIEEDSFIEIYDASLTQTYRSPDFLGVTGHGLMALETLEYFELFERAESVTIDQHQVIEKLMQGEIKRPIFKPIDDHHVKEINSNTPRISLVEVNLYSPLLDDEEVFQGILHVFKIHKQNSLKFDLIKNPKFDSSRLRQ